jgi:hypothetical protein
MTMREFSQSIREKFGMRQNFKVEIKDDGDMITMADQDDLDMAIDTAKDNARRAGETPKMEVSHSSSPFILDPLLTTSRSGFAKYRLEIPQHNATPS